MHNFDATPLVRVADKCPALAVAYDARVAEFTLAVIDDALKRESVRLAYLWEVRRSLRATDSVERHDAREVCRGHFVLECQDRHPCFAFV